MGFGGSGRFQKDWSSRSRRGRSPGPPSPKRGGSPLHGGGRAETMKPGGCAPSWMVKIVHAKADVWDRETRLVTAWRQPSGPRRLCSVEPAARFLCDGPYRMKRACLSRRTQVLPPSECKSCFPRSQTISILIKFIKKLLTFVFPNRYSLKVYYMINLKILML